MVFGFFLGIFFWVFWVFLGIFVFFLVIFVVFFFGIRYLPPEFTPGSL